MKNMAALLMIGLVAFMAMPDIGLGKNLNKPASDPTELARRAGEVLERCCVECHSGPGSKAGRDFGFDVRDVKSLVDAGMVVPKPTEEKASAGWKLDDSDLWKRMKQSSMPPPNDFGLARPTGDDAEVIGEWITAGAPEFPPIKVRPPISLQTTLTQIRDHLNGIHDEDLRRRFRYFSLVELYNQPHISDAKLELARAALAKAVNSLSWEREQVDPEALDKERTIFAVDIPKTRLEALNIGGRFVNIILTPLVIRISTTTMLTRSVGSRYPSPGQQ